MLKINLLHEQIQDKSCLSPYTGLPPRKNKYPGSVNIVFILAPTLRAPFIFIAALEPAVDQISSLACPVPHNWIPCGKELFLGK